MEAIVLRDGVKNTITPHCTAISLSSKPPTNVLVTGGIDGDLSVTPYYITEDVALEETKVDLSSPITALISVDNSPLVVVGTYDGRLHCIHIGRKVDANDQSALNLHLAVLMNEQVSKEAVTNLSYQESTKKLAVVTSNGSNHQVSIACLEPNNMKVIGTFDASYRVDSLVWGRDDFKLLVGYENSISCYDVIGMTFENETASECLWTRSVPRFQRMVMNDAGNVIYGIDGRRSGIFTVSILNAQVEEKLTVMHYEGNADSSASCCLLLVGGRIVTGSVSGEVCMCLSNDKHSWETVSSHSCAATGLCSVESGFLSVRMDGSVIEHRQNGSVSRIAVPSSTLWDYLVSFSSH